MGYGDYTPSGGGRTKPLTKKQLEKAKKAFAQADAISAKVKELEIKEGTDAEAELGQLNLL